MEISKSWLSYLLDIDEKIFLFINKAHHPLWDTVVYWITHEAFWIPLYLLLLYLIIQKLKHKTWLVLLAIILLITICDQFASSLIKPWAQRLRPCFNPSLQPIVHVVGRHRGLYGFISSHAANTFGITIFLTLLLKRYYSYMPILFIWSISVSYARIYGGVHYPADVLVGALSGLLWGLIMYVVYVFTLKSIRNGKLSIK